MKELVVTLTHAEVKNERTFFQNNRNINFVKVRTNVVQKRDKLFYHSSQVSSLKTNNIQFNRHMGWNDSSLIETIFSLQLVHLWVFKANNNWIVLHVGQYVNYFQPLWDTFLRFWERGWIPLELHLPNKKTSNGKRVVNIKKKNNKTNMCLLQIWNGSALSLDMFL